MNQFIEGSRINSSKGAESIHRREPNQSIEESLCLEKNTVTFFEDQNLFEEVEKILLKILILENIPILVWFLCWCGVVFFLKKEMFKCNLEWIEFCGWKNENLWIRWCFGPSCAPWSIFVDFIGLVFLVPPVYVYWHALMTVLLSRAMKERAMNETRWKSQFNEPSAHCSMVPAARFSAKFIPPPPSGVTRRP